MAPERRSRAQLVREILSGFQEVSGHGVVLSQLIADKVGMTPSDLESMGFLEQHGAMTAGRLAELTGLTGAVTRMIDRLVAAGHVRRRPDPQDRRRVIVELVPGATKRFARYYGPMAADTKEFLARYSEKDLEVIVDLLRRQLDFGRRHAARIQALPEEPRRSRVDVKAKLLGQKVRVRF